MARILAIILLSTGIILAQSNGNVRVSLWKHTTYVTGTYTGSGILMATSISLSGAQGGIVYLETSPDNSTWTEIGRVSNIQGGALVVGLTLTQTFAGSFTADVPAGYYVRLRSSSTVGSPTYTYLSGQETLL